MNSARRAFAIAGIFSCFWFNVSQGVASGRPIINTIAPWPSTAITAVSASKVAIAWEPWVASASPSTFVVSKWIGGGMKSTVATTTGTKHFLVYDTGYRGEKTNYQILEPSTGDTYTYTLLRAPSSIWYDSATQALRWNNVSGIEIQDLYELQVKVLDGPWNTLGTYFVFMPSSPTYGVSMAVPSLSCSYRVRTIHRLNTSPDPAYNPTMTSWWSPVFVLNP